MAQMKIVGNALVIESKVPFSDFEKVMNYRPEALVIREDERILYSVEVSRNQRNEGFVCDENCSFCKSFGNKATYTQIYCTTDRDTVEELKADLIEIFGKSLKYINQIEDQVLAVLPEIAADVVKIQNAITIE